MSIITLMCLSPFLAYLSWLDIRQHLILNKIVIPLSLLGILLSPFTIGIQMSSLGIVSALVMLLPYVVGMGAGDVKLMIMIGAWFGPYITLIAIGIGLAVGGLLMITGKWKSLPLAPCLSLGVGIAVIAIRGMP